MATPNLNLDEISITDNIQDSLLNKMNSNLEKIDTAYGQLTDSLLSKTGKTNLAEAIEVVDNLNADATVTADKLLNNEIAYGVNGRVVGTMQNKAGTSTSASGSVSGNNYRLQIPTSGYYGTNSYLTRNKTSVMRELGVTPMPNITVTCDASTSYITSYGAGIDNNGTLVIWAMTGSTNYEHVYFYPTSIIGTQGVGWSISSWDTADPVACYACTITGLSSYSNINVNLVYNTVNSSYDYVRLNVTVTGS